MNVLGDEVKEVESFVIVYKYKDRFTSPFARTLRSVIRVPFFISFKFFYSQSDHKNVWKLLEQRCDSRQFLELQSYSCSGEYIKKKKLDCLSTL